jgi:hypothetical protein
MKAAKDQAKAVAQQVAALNEHCQQLQLSLTQQVCVCVFKRALCA